jgi:DNA-binding FadR family transcriptional regulator
MATRVKLHEQIMAEVLGEIISGRYDDERSLPREVDIAERHGVSRYVARESIQALRDRGVLTVKHGVGTTIAPQAEWNIFDTVLLEALLRGPGGRAAAGEARECRVLLWPEAAALAAQRRTEDDLERLEESVGQGDVAFGAALARAAHNRFLRHILVALDAATLTEAAAARGGRRATARRRVLDAVRKRDGETAREAMTALAGTPRRRGR